MFTAIQYVSGGFTLVAFLVAALVWVRLREVRRDERAIASATGDHLVDVLDGIAGRRIRARDLASLTKGQKFDIVNRELALRHEQSRAQLRYGLAALTLLLLLTAYLVYQGRRDPFSLPALQEAIGTTSADLSLTPQPGPLTASIRASTVAHISPQGWAELAIFVNGQRESCGKERAYWNWSKDSTYRIVVDCKVAVERFRPYTFRAVQTNENADAHETTLTATYSH